MKARRTPALAALAMLLAAQAAPAQRRMFPPDAVGSVWWADLVEDEPSLRRPGDRRGFASRIRLSMSGIARLKVVIRLDEYRGGGATGRVILAQRSRTSDALVVDVDRRFRATARQMASLRERIAAAQLWRAGPREHWTSTDPGAICLDGIQLVFERADQAGYRFSEANAQCTATPALLAVARTMIELSGERRPLPLLQ